MTGDPPSPKRLRPSAKAVVVSEGALLVNRNRFPDRAGEWLGLPGGGQRPGETIVDAMRREVAEETGYLVEPIRLLWVRELIVALRPEIPFDKEDHAIEFMFESRLIGEQGTAGELDEYQLGTAWVSPDELEAVTFFPRAAVTPLVDLMHGRDPGPAYLGHVV